MTKNTVTISKKVKRVSLQRYLWSRIAFDDHPATFRILAGLMINQLWLEQKASKDKEFKNKFKQVLETSSTLLKELNLSRGFSEKALKRLSTKSQKELEGFLVPRRNYAQWKQRFDSSVVLIRQKPLGVNTKQLKPERYIGIGYRDKGTAKIPAEDGSPSWQEVAQSDRYLKHQIEKEMKNVEKCETAFERIKHLSKAAKLLAELQEQLPK